MKNLIVLLLLSVSISANAGIYNLEMPARKPGIFGVKDNTPAGTFDLKPDLTKCQVRYDKIKEQQLALVIERQEINRAGVELNQARKELNELREFYNAKRYRTDDDVRDYNEQQRNFNQTVLALKSKDEKNAELLAKSRLDMSVFDTECRSK